MIKTLTFVTGNVAKAEQLARHLSFSVKHRKLDLPEIQSLDPTEIIEHKVKEAYEIIRGPVLVEDTSLIFCALGKLPGPLIKWFLKELGNKGLCKLVNLCKDRSAIATVSFGLYDGKKIINFTNSVNGTIAKSPRGEAGFGWDPIFIVDGYKKTWAEMTDREQKQSSLRRGALKKLEKYLRKT